MTTDVVLPECPEYCTEFCRHLLPGPHVSESIVVAKGGAMAEPDPKVGTVDLVPSVAFHQLRNHPAKVVISPQVWIRDRFNWVVPGETAQALPELEMTPERALYLADVLRETALTALVADGRVVQP